MSFIIYFRPLKNFFLKQKNQKPFSNLFMLNASINNINKHTFKNTKHRKQNTHSQIENIYTQLCPFDNCALGLLNWRKTSPIRGPSRSIKNTFASIVSKTWETVRGQDTDLFSKNS